jgi:hypothetical protein
MLKYKPMLKSMTLFLTLENTTIQMAEKELIFVLRVLTRKNITKQLKNISSSWVEQAPFFIVIGYHCDVISLRPFLT